MARLRHASKRADAQTILRERDALPETEAAPLLSPDLTVAFLARVLRNGGSCATAEGRRGAVEAIGEFVAARHRQRRVVAGHDPRLAALPWRDAGVLPRFGAADADDPVGVSYASCAVAESGSVLLRCNRDNPARNSLLVEDHIVLVEQSAIVTRLEEAWELPGDAGAANRPRGAMLISGPSSTADIEKKLVTGAHGPCGWHVVVLGTALAPDLMSRAAELAER